MKKEEFNKLNAWEKWEIVRKEVSDTMILSEIIATYIGENMFNNIISNIAYNNHLIEENEEDENIFTK